ncbi:hypothetical protein [Brevibacillus dissolubilis]|uniref:hypothetical protein n=1 Tax=Brevibacillus dissolubilis TaxID=1844116 RepID=UPI0021001001|nr:hypothetical protein [Brevibacillus dissolubilis]
MAGTFIKSNARQKGITQTCLSGHCPFDAGQVFRVLQSGGLFLTQQVAESDKQNLKEAFGRGQSYGVPDGQLLATCMEDMQKVGFLELEALEYTVTEYYQSPKDLIFLLKHTPIIPHFGEVDGDVDRLMEFIAANQTEKGIRTTAKRFVLTGRKHG